MAAKPKNTNNKKEAEASFGSEVTLLLILAVCIIWFISHFGIGGFLGERISSLSFGLFGMMSYLAPVCFFVGAAFFVSNRDNGVAMIKLVAGALFVSFLCLFVELVVGGGSGYSVKDSFQYAVEHKNGGGALGGILSCLLCPLIGKAGAYVLDVIVLIISLVLLTERSFLGGLRKGGRKVYDTAKEDAVRKKGERKDRKKEKKLLKREQKLQRREQGQKEWERSQRRMDKKVEGVALDTKIYPMQGKRSDNISELKLPAKGEAAHPRKQPGKQACPQADGELQDIFAEPLVVEKVHRKPKGSQGSYSESSEDMQRIELEEELQEAEDALADAAKALRMEEDAYMGIRADGQEARAEVLGAPSLSQREMEAAVLDKPKPGQREMEAAVLDKPKPGQPEEKQELFGEDGKPLGWQGQVPALGTDYAFPPISLLKQGDAKQGDNKQHLHATAIQLQQILKNFGVNVTITNVSCGPSVTRYELQPELGVKVSKIVNLADDIKLNLAAADIRIEAPIPGKAAVGIEVPNKKKVMVRFRELVEDAAFINHKSSICFTVGKDIGGQVVVADIAKMPHLLIAGATGSGKSVCINTIIMSILYKANPEDVKLILIDPKVVELSVYNGIPHLFIPVVTDPKKAAGALHWAVAEMTDRYQKFAEYQVRDLKGYNQKVEKIRDVEDETKPGKLPQIVIIVDELADLMMVAPGDVEDAICRLAQLARAAGIHLIIATQRPSVDVITGLIKANMPSRIAFSVSSGVDSRTILDMVGAEKLLGNGDMLFYPQGYQKPLRVQGPFVSDTEVEDVVDFLKKQSTVVYNTEIEEKMNNVSVSAGGPGASGGNERDAYFMEAGRFVIEKEKGSIGMLQRMFKIGFNRAARIMDQLEEAGVVGPEEGTKPRKILMSLAEFEDLA